MAVFRSPTLASLLAMLLLKGAFKHSRNICPELPGFLRQVNSDRYVQSALSTMFCHAHRLCACPNDCKSLFTSTWPGHLLRPDQHVELLRADIAEPERLLAERRAVLVRGLGDLGRLVVADLRRERGHEHE